MNDEEAKETLVHILRTRGRARNSELLEALRGDVDRFTRIREDLIFNDLAEDKKGAGLIWLGPTSPQAPAPSAEPEPVARLPRH